MEQFSACPYLLKRKKISAFVVNAGQAVANKLFRDICQPVSIALFLLFWCERLALPNVVKHVAHPVGNSSGEFAIFVVVVSSARAVWSVLVHSSQFQCFAIVVGRMAAAMMDAYRMLGRDLVQVVHVELPVVFYIGIIEKVTLDPKALGVLWALATSLSTCWRS